MHLFRPRKRSTLPSRLSRVFRFESLERRMLLAGDTAGSDAELLPDFELVDVNPDSPTYNTQVSPRDLMGKAGAVYFAHLT